MPESRYFLLANHHGVTANGNLEPIVEVGLAVVVDTIVGEGDQAQIVGQEQRVTLIQSPSLKHPDTKVDLPARIMPGSRIIEAVDYRVIEALQRTGLCEEIEKPTKGDVDKHVKALTDAVEEAGTHEPAPGEQPEQASGGVAVPLTLAEALKRPIPIPEPAPEPETPAEESTTKSEEA